MTELTQLRDYCEFLDEVQGEIDLDALVTGVRPTPAPTVARSPQRLRRGWAIGVAVAILVLVAFLPLALRPGNDETPPADITSTTITETPTTSLPPATTTSTVTTTTTTWPPASPFQGKIAFYQDGAIRVIDAAGDLQVLPLPFSGSTTQVEWSPDRTRIAFTDLGDDQSVANQPPPNELFVMDVDGDNRKQLFTTPNGFVQWLEWSPDGARIAFNYLDDDKWGPAVVEVDSGTITAGPDNHFIWDPASWSPDSSRIALQGPEPGVYVADAEFTAVERLTTGNDVDPVWSPDGTLMAFFRGADGQDLFRQGADIYLVAQDGTNPTLLTSAPIHWAHQHPSLVWSPDGTRIAAMAQVPDDNSNDLYAPYLIDVVDGTVTRLPGLFGSPYDLAWSPEGTHLAFSDSLRAWTADGTFLGESGIYVIDADGTGITRLVDGEATGLAWLSD